MKVSKYFTLREATYSATAEKLKIDNSPNDIELANIKNTAESMDMIRALLGNPVMVSSWFRGSKLNAAIDGSLTSSHLSGKAVDFSCPAFGTIEEVCKKIRDSGIKFDQLIWEQAGNKQWCHIGFGSLMRQQVMSWVAKERLQARTGEIMKLVKNWHKKWSVWLLGVATGLAGMEQFLPQLQQVMPANWYQYAFVLILAARMIQQAGQDD